MSYRRIVRFFRCLRESPLFLVLRYYTRNDTRPKKSYSGFPLFLHQTGQWAKKVRGRIRCFGTDRDKALDHWLRGRDDLLAGRTSRGRSDGLQIRDLVNRFLTSKQPLVDSGELSPRTHSHYYGTCQRLIEAFAKKRPVENLAPEDFGRLRTQLASGRGAHALAGEVQRVRTLFEYAREEELISKPVHFGTVFRKPSAKQMRMTKHEAEPWMIDAEDLRQILDAAGWTLRPQARMESWKVGVFEGKRCESKEIELSFRRNVKVERTARVLQLSGLFDLPPTQRSESTCSITLPVEDEPWEAGIPEFWLVDARGDDARGDTLRFEILKRGPKGYTAVRKQGGWLKSAVLGQSFKFRRETDVQGNPEFTLDVK